MFENNNSFKKVAEIIVDIVEKHNILTYKVNALEDYLSIEYKEETTKGYVKKNLKAK